MLGVQAVGSYLDIKTFNLADVVKARSCDTPMGGGGGREHMERQEGGQKRSIID